MIRHETINDIEAREALLDAAFGADRARKTSERLREGRMPAEGLSLVAEKRGVLVATVRHWHISAGAERRGLLLGPLAVDSTWRNRGIGARLIRHAVAAARRLGYRAVLLVGDAPYYGRFGFSAEKTGALYLPGPFDPRRLLALELTAGALDGAAGPIVPTGLPLPNPALHVPQADGMPRAA
jgi:predicted N-acetyltransferase YhbS